MTRTRYANRVCFGRQLLPFYAPLIKPNHLLLLASLNSQPANFTNSQCNRYLTIRGRKFNILPSLILLRTQPSKKARRCEIFCVPSLPFHRSHAGIIPLRKCRYGDACGLHALESFDDPLASLLYLPVRVSKNPSHLTN